MVNRTQTEAQINRWLTESEASPLLLTGRASDHTVKEILSANTDVEVISIDTEGKTITIKEVRTITEAIGRTSLKDTRVVHIVAAHRLRTESANALLKQLEDSPASTKFLLSTPYPGRLLATIRSRCQIIRTHGANPKESINNPTPTFDPKRKTPLSEDEVTVISEMLSRYILREPNSAAVRRSLMRLRDYYKISALNGNSRLAGDVLLASLLELPNTAK